MLAEEEEVLPVGKYASSVEELVETEELEKLSTEL